MMKMEILDILRNADLTMNQQADMLAEMVRRQLEIHKQMFESEREMIVDAAYGRGFDDGFTAGCGWGVLGIDDDTGFAK